MPEIRLPSFFVTSNFKIQNSTIQNCDLFLPGVSGALCASGRANEKHFCSTRPHLGTGRFKRSGLWHIVASDAKQLWSALLPALFGPHVYGELNGPRKGVWCFPGFNFVPIRRPTDPDPLSILEKSLKTFGIRFGTRFPATQIRLATLFAGHLVRRSAKRGGVPDLCSLCLALCLAPRLIL